MLNVKFPLNVGCFLTGAASVAFSRKLFYVELPAKFDNNHFLARP
jgi:hypothetical protein